MKRLLCLLMSALMMISLFACGEEERVGKEFTFNEHGIKVVIPAVWDAAGFLFYYNEDDTEGAEYRSLELKAVIGGDEALILTVAAYPEESWPNWVKAYPEETEKLEIGTSKDGKTHYTLLFAETIFEDEDDQKKFDEIVAAAKKSCINLEITE